MGWALIASLALVLSNAAPIQKPRPHLVRVAAPPQYELASAYDVEPTQRLLRLTNEARVQAGAPPLQLDPGLTQAAQAHAAEMAAQGEIAHQFPGEPSVPQRLASATSLHLDHSGENVAYADSVERAQESLLNSPPHRENLLNPAYNVVGLGVARAGDSFYVVQDFAHSVPGYSTASAEDVVADTIARVRARYALAPLQRFDDRAAQPMACAMAQANSLNVSSPPARYTVRYTNTAPAALPEVADRAIADRAVRAYSVGTCYARTASYPSGVYWVMLLFY